MIRQHARQVGGVALIATTVISICSLQGARVAAAPQGEAVFKNNCASCHAGGKNLVDPKKPIIGSKKLASKEEFKIYVAKGSGAMPAAPQVANDDATLQALYTYCKSLK